MMIKSQAGQGDGGRAAAISASLAREDLAEPFGREDVDF